ncbi:LysR family transcriptional regulator [Actinomadura sp. NPDC047616]|uniref:LysR family transcriptional regulator n=1 Tax=Actinomadura sp. NPDC047616 TaxID=3155914 RepID=UPI0033CA8094
MDLDLGAVRAFVAVADARFFGDAADVLGLSQQAVSKRVARLEADLGTALFHRTRTGAELTEDGAAFLVNARALLALADQSVALLRSRHRALRVDVLSSRIATNEVVRDFHASVPDLEIETVRSKEGLRAIAPALVRGEIDASFARVTGELDEAVAHAPAYADRMHVLVGRRHPLASERQVPVAALRGMTAWMPGLASPDTEWAEYYRHFTARFGVHMDASGPNFGLDDDVERVAASADVISLVGERMRVPWNPDVVQLPIVDPVPVFPFSLLWHRQNRHPALPTLISYVRRHFRPLDASTHWLPAQDRPGFTR